MNNKGRFLHDMEQRALLYWGMSATDSKHLSEELWKDGAFISDAIREFHPQGSIAIPGKVFELVGEILDIADDIEGAARDGGDPDKEQTNYDTIIGLANDIKGKGDNLEDELLTFPNRQEDKDESSQ